MNLTSPFLGTPSHLTLCHVSDTGPQSTTAGTAAVGALVATLNPDVLLHTGDFVHPGGTSYPVDFGTYFAKWPAFKAIFPCPGNHDWDYDGLQSYSAYFDDPVKNRRHYDVKVGPVHLFMLDSDNREMDGNSITSNQHDWFAEAVSLSDMPWKIACMHHSPYTSYAAYAPGSAVMEWDFAGLVDLVISGNSHVYERFLIDDLTYVVDSLGGGDRRTVPATYPYREASYTDDWGSLFLDITESSLKGRLYNTSQVVCDDFELTK